MKTIAIVPAHNESEQIKETVTELKKQNIDEVIVACDNCTDDTEFEANSAGAKAFLTIENSSRKAGALNQALNRFVDLKEDPDLLVLICDADTIINEGWVENASRLLKRNNIDAVGSIFKAIDSNGFLKYCQKLEWERYSREVQIKKKVFVLTGTASLIKGTALQKVYDKFGHYYDENSITEDFTMTLDLKEVGCRLISPASCVANTETMPTAKLLFLQRRRWYLGALQQMKNRKWTLTLIPYLFQQLMLNVSVFSFMLLLFFSFYLLASGNFAISPFWSLIGLIFAAERTITVWESGWKARIFAASVVPELVYAFLLQVSYIGAWIQMALGSTGTWNHIEKPISSKSEHFIK
ncbi:glycosyltransferase family 2 protein [Paucilactobacillus kaifaensis]|uniref:glycosyltransferase family 2 protein n=1 Tax=Paucilactobacillus kaifaensis TaxID=2559921 RepID=UPI0010F4A9B5|nr:glycosyltransferase family 2 protein [Paucilactobacillus kaifaensis]